MMDKILNHVWLHNVCVKVFKAMNCSESHAEEAAQVLLSADLRGIDSHGIARLSGYYSLFLKGRINTKPHIHIIYEKLSTATVNADGALGLNAAPFAMQIAIDKAQKYGTGWVAVQNSNHFGIAGYHAMLALPHDMIGIAMTNASPLVAPTNSKERLLGTNPMAFAIPTGTDRPFVADFATTTAANGKLEILQRKGLDTPTGWIQDKNGASSTNPNELKSGGALLPLGSDNEHGSHKGYCLGAVVDILSAVLSGANYGPWVPPFVSFLEPPTDPVGNGIGHFFGAMRVDAFRPADDFKKHMQNWIKTFIEAERINKDKPVMIPGWPEQDAYEKRIKDGIPVNEKVWNDLNQLCDQLHIKISN